MANRIQRGLLIPSIFLLSSLMACKTRNIYLHRDIERETHSDLEWRPLFNGRNLEGWHASEGGSWEVNDGIIFGKSEASEPLHGILLTDREFSDFKLKVIFKAVKGNSGVYFRVTEVEAPVRVHGFQAEIDPRKDTGGLYETGGRDWVVKRDPKEVQKWNTDGWNEMIILCIGSHITVWVNGLKTAELINDPGRRSGFIGIQLHGNMDMDVQFKNIMIHEY